MAPIVCPCDWGSEANKHLLVYAKPKLQIPQTVLHHQPTAQWPPQLVQRPHIPTAVTHPFAVGQRLPRFLLFPFIITVHLIVKKVLEGECT